MNRSLVLKELEKKIIGARNANKIAETKLAEIFETLNAHDIDYGNIIMNCEYDNRSLEEYIASYIEYSEGNVDRIINEIKKHLKEE